MRAGLQQRALAGPAFRSCATGLKTSGCAHAFCRPGSAPPPAWRCHTGSTAASRRRTQTLRHGPRTRPRPFRRVSLTRNAGRGALPPRSLCSHSAATTVARSPSCRGWRSDCSTRSCSALANADAGERAQKASGVICVAIVCRAMVPPASGRVADLAGIRSAGFVVPDACYVPILGFRIWAVKTDASGEGLKGAQI